MYLVWKLFLPRAEDVHILFTYCAGEIKTIGGGIRVPWTLFLVSFEISMYSKSIVHLTIEENVCTYSMEGDLSKKSIHIIESFVHAIFIGIVVNSYSDIVAYI